MPSYNNFPSDKVSSMNIVDSLYENAIYKLTRVVENNTIILVKGLHNFSLVILILGIVFYESIINTKLVNH